MSEKVVSLRPDPHAQGPCVCLSCRHEWRGVWPVGTDELECPACGLLKGVSKGLYYPDEGEPIRVCQCGNEFFLMRPDGHFCPACGRYQRYE
ncbi:hypothetical protein [Algiphilus aromaticivorans]|uniref:hypothetical protein n=1 Tax=Algiphilus aromaticivorans TaxID=382454 RepID=UPI0005C1E30F|nr:hypothetical protein [Algiphilus aromaticivorans]